MTAAEPVLRTTGLSKRFGAREAFRTTGRVLPIHTSVSLLPNGGKMLLGTDVSAVLTTMDALKVDVLGLNCSTGPEDMRDAIRFLGEHSPLPVHCIPNAGIPIQGPNGLDVVASQVGQAPVPHQTSQSVRPKGQGSAPVRGSMATGAALPPASNCSAAPVRSMPRTDVAVVIGAGSVFHTPCTRPTARSRASRLVGAKLNSFTRQW